MGKVRRPSSVMAALPGRIDMMACPIPALVAAHSSASESLTKTISLAVSGVVVVDVDVDVVVMS